MLQTNQQPQFSRQNKGTDLFAEIKAAIKTGHVPSEMGVTFSGEACQQAKRLAKEANLPEPYHLRVYLEGKGCDGFYYGVTFDEPRETDLIFEAAGDFGILVDQESLQYLHGSSVDWVDDERGQGFLVNNPQHRRFRGKFFKRSAWRDTFEAKESKASTS